MHARAHTHTDTHMYRDKWCLCECPTQDTFALAFIAFQGCVCWHNHHVPICFSREDTEVGILVKVVNTSYQSPGGSCCALDTRRRTHYAPDLTPMNDQILDWVERDREGEKSKTANIDRYYEGIWGESGYKVAKFAWRGQMIRNTVREEYLLPYQTWCHLNFSLRSPLMTWKTQTNSRQTNKSYVLR